MCGIVGYLGKMTKERQSAFKDMLQMDVVRGWDGTGVAFIKKGDVKILKGTFSPQELLQDVDYLSYLNKGSPTIGLLGHNRAATRGLVSPENAHPFNIGDITLAHNGTLFTQYGLPDNHKFKTDSEAITHSINEQGITETWQAIHGAAALAWWDRKRYSLSLITTGDRPLCYILTKDESGLFFASEAWMIRGACSRNNIELAEVAVKFLEKNKLQEFRYSTKKEKIRQQETELAPFVFKPRERDWGHIGEIYYYSHAGYSNTRERNNYSNIVSNINDRKIPIQLTNNDTKQINNSGTIVNLPLSEQTKLDNVWSTEKKISEEEFSALYTNCCYCGTGLQYEYEDAVILDHNTAACGDCVSHAKKYGMYGIQQH